MLICVPPCLNNHLLLILIKLKIFQICLHKKKEQLIFIFPVHSVCCLDVQAISLHRNKFNLKNNEPYL